MNALSCLGNVIWLVFGGIFGALSWCVAGCLWCVTIVGIPIGLQCFKFAGLSLAPFGKEVIYGGGSVSLILNVIWLIISGIPLALGHFISAVLLTLTIIGYPFAVQSLKLAKLSLMPFGAQVIKVH